MFFCASFLLLVVWWVVYVSVFETKFSDFWCVDNFLSFSGDVSKWVCKWLVDVQIQISFEVMWIHWFVASTWNALFFIRVVIFNGWIAVVYLVSQLSFLWWKWMFAWKFVKITNFRQIQTSSKLKLAKKVYGVMQTTEICIKCQQINIKCKLSY